LAILEAKPENRPAHDAQHAQGRLTARERIEVLCDEGSFEDEDCLKEASGDPSVVTGSGTIHGRHVFVFAKDHTYYSGSLSAAHAEKIVALQNRAMAAQAPLIGLFDSGGLRFEDGMAALAGYGEMVRNHVEASGVTPRISLIMGPCIGADALAASLADFIFMVSETSTLLVTGPEITHRLTGEELDAQALGGADLHTQTSGLADAAFDDDIAALTQLRRLIDFLPSSHQDGVPERPSFDVADRIDPSLDTLVPIESATPYDVKELIFKILDEGDFFELQERFAKNIIVGFGRMACRTIGIVANQPLVLGGVLDVRAAKKAARFIGFCGRFNIPLLTVVDVPGFLPGLDQEETGLARESATLLSAYAKAGVPKVTVILGQAYGAAFVMMGSKSLGTDITFAWPSARIGLMKADGASLSAGEAQVQGLVDAIIEARMTRTQILTALSALRDKAKDLP
jgi:propionyl-CoA carboxylase beta chain